MSGSVERRRTNLQVDPFGCRCGHMSTLSYAFFLLSRYMFTVNFWVSPLEFAEVVVWSSRAIWTI